MRTDTVTARAGQTLSTGSTSHRRHCVALRRGSFAESFDFQSSSQLASPAAYLQQRGPLNTAPPPWRPFALLLFTARSSEQDCGRGRWSGIRLGACRRLALWTHNNTALRQLAVSVMLYTGTTRRRLDVGRHSAPALDRK